MTMTSADLAHRLQSTHDIGVEFISFIKFAFSNNSQVFGNPPMHYDLASKLGNGMNNIVISVFRGGAKTTLVEFWILFLVYMDGKLVTRPKAIEFVLYFGKDNEMARQFIENVYLKWEESEFLQEFISIPSKEYLKESMTLQSKRPKSNYKLRLVGKGIEGNFRGMRKGNNRPDEILVDDILSTEMARSDILTQSIKDIFNKGVVPMGSKFTRLVYIGTPVSPNDLLTELVNNPYWTTHRYPLCNKFPCERSEFISNWPENFDYDRVNMIYSMAKNSSSGLAGFYQEYMLESKDLSTLLVDPSTIERRDIMSIRQDFSNYNIYIATDFATSPKKSADFSAIGVFAVNSGGDRILIDGIAKKQEITRTWDDLFMLVSKYTKPGPVSPEVGIEVFGMQLGYIDQLRRESDLRNIPIRFAVDKDRQLLGKDLSFNYGIRPKGDKTERFVHSVVPQLMNHKIWIGYALRYDSNFSELVEELLKELTTVTLKTGLEGLEHDDALDILVQLEHMSIRYPSRVEYTEEVYKPGIGNFYFNAPSNQGNIRRNYF